MPTFQDPFDNEDYLNLLSGCSVTGGRLVGSTGVVFWTASSTNLGSNFSSSSIDSILHTTANQGGSSAHMQLSCDGASWMSSGGDDVSIGSYLFDGINDKISFSSSASLSNTGARSIMGWVNFTSMGATHTLIQKGRGFGAPHLYEWFIGVAYGNLYARITDGSTHIIDINFPVESGFKLGQWQQFALTWDGTTGAGGAKFYIDGSEFLSVASSSSSAVSGSDNVCIGLREDLGGGGFDGSISDIRIYSAEISSSAISNLYLYNIEPPTDDLEAHWRFNGDALDETANNNDGTISGAVNSTALADIPNIGDSLGPYRTQKFDGINDYVNCGSDASLDDMHTSGFTFSAWIHPDTVGGGNFGRIFDKSTNTTYLYLHSASGSRAKIGFVKNTTSTGWVKGSADYVINLGEWNHIGIRWTGLLSNDPAIYVNGNLVVLTSNTAGGTFTSDAGGDLYLGNRTGANRSFDGKMSDVIFYSSELTEAQVQDIYLKGEIPSGYVSRWKLEGDFTDEAGTNNGTNSGSTEVIDISRPRTDDVGQAEIDVSSIGCLDDFYYRILGQKLSGESNTGLNEITVSYTYTSSAGEEIKNMSFASSSGNEVLINSRDKFCVMILAVSSSSNCTLRKNSSSGEIICHVPAGNSKFKASIGVEDGNNIYVEGSSNISIVYTWAAD
tara:strand:- start:8729 stop:10738 length:2010 start_codon:yes stop_codon:yes gene_type:complete